MTYTTEIKQLTPKERGWIGKLYNSKGLLLRQTQNHCAKELAITALNKHIRDYNGKKGTKIPEIEQTKSR